MMERKDRIAVPDLYHLDLAQRWLGQLHATIGKPERFAERKKD
jgi:hypothetical protein